MRKECYKYYDSEKIWIARFVNKDGKLLELHFSVSKYGNKKAEELARLSFENKEDMREKNNKYEDIEDCTILYIKYKGMYFKSFINKEDKEKVQKYKWYIRLSKKEKTWYVYGRINKKNISLHRYLMNFPKKLLVDHIDKNGLNNRRNNLRIVEKYINNRNTRLRSDNKSGIQGVYFHTDKYEGQWRCKWYDENHKMCQKAFAVKKYGYEKAKSLAIQTRIENALKNEYALYGKMTLGLK